MKEIKDELLHRIELALQYSDEDLSGFLFKILGVINRQEVEIEALQQENDKFKLNRK